MFQKEEKTIKRCITVTGTGNFAAKPDLIIVSIGLSVMDPAYEKAMSEAGEQIEALRSALADVGFQKNQLKTTSFYEPPNMRTKEAEMVNIIGILRVTKWFTGLNWKLILIRNSWAGY